MPAFRFRALDLQGSRKSGIIDAQTIRLARARLRDQGLFPEDIVPVSERRSLTGGRLGAAELTLTTRQWADLLAAGLTVEQSLTVLMEQAESNRLKDVLATLRADVMAGHTLASALGRQSKIFPDIYRALAAAGEKGGRLPEVLGRLADHLDNRRGATQRAVQALAYPVILTVAAFAIIAVLMTYVVPQVTAVFAHAKQQLPLLTRLLMGGADLLRAWGLPVLIVAGLGVWGFRRALRAEALRLRWHEFLLRLPFAGRLLRLADAGRFTETVATLVGAGISLLAALEAGRDVVWALPLRSALEKVISQVREGVPLSRALAKTDALPPVVRHLVASAEQTGALDAMLGRAAAQVRGDLNHRLAVATALFEPLLVLAMGLMVLTIVLAMLAPILEINLLLR